MVQARLITGGMHVDARGVLRFCNAFDMAAVRRFYTIVNSAVAPCRGWIGHRRETKWFFPLRGETRLRVRGMDGGAEESFCLDAGTPAVLHVPPGNWFAVEQIAEAEVLVFSDRSVGESRDDDFREPL